MSGNKRSHDDLLAAEAAVSSSASYSSKKPTASSSRDTGDEHADKKLKQLDPTENSQAPPHGDTSPLITEASSKVLNLKQKQAGMPKQLEKHKQLKKGASTKKKEATANTVDEEMSDAPSGEPSSGTTLQRKKAVPRKSGKLEDATIDADQMMSDTPSSAGDDEAGVSSTQSATAEFPFTPIHPVLARDLANNTYAPKKTTAAQQAYLTAVGQLFLHPQHHPLQTPNSKLSKQIRHAIHERFFLGKTNEECLPTWNTYGSNAKSAQAISKALLRDTATWFAEENAVLPWMARRNDEKSNLKKGGMGPGNFPAPSTTTPPPAAPAPAPARPAPSSGAVAGSRNAKTSKKQSISNASELHTTSKPKASESSKQDASQVMDTIEAMETIEVMETIEIMDTIEVDASMVDADGQEGDEEDDYGERLSDDGTINSEHSGSVCSDAATDLGSDSESEPDSDSKLYSAPILDTQYESDYSDSDLDSVNSDNDNFPTVASEVDFSVKFADSTGIEPKIRALIMAATTAFDLGALPVVALIVDGVRYKVRADDLVKHCGFVRNVVAQGQPCRDFDLTEYDPTIVRAFIQAITSPGRRDPKNQLPEYVFDFEFTDNKDMHGWDHSDPVGVIDGDRRKFHKIDWDVGACIMMYQLADVFDCSLVRNLVVDQLRILYEEEKKSIETGRKRILKQSRVPLELLGELDLEAHHSFICTLGAMYAYRMWSRRDAAAQFQWPSEVSDEVVGAIEEWMEDKQVTFSTTDQERYCFRYHHHAAGEVCHMSTKDEDLPYTRELIDDLFSSLRNEAAKQHAVALADFDRYNPDERLAYNAILLRGEMFQWTFRREEKVAYELLQHEYAREGSSRKNPDKYDRSYYQRMLKRLEWTPHLQNLRIEHWDRWNVFEREWMLGARLEEAMKGEYDSSEPAPWIGD